MLPRAPTGEHVHDRDEHGPIARRGNTTILCRAQNVVDKGSTLSHNASGASRCDHTSSTTVTMPHNDPTHAKHAISPLTRLDEASPAGIR